MLIFLKKILSPLTKKEIINNQSNDNINIIGDNSGVINKIVIKIDQDYNSRIIELSRRIDELTLHLKDKNELIDYKNSEIVALKAERLLIEKEREGLKLKIQNYLATTDYHNLETSTTFKLSFDLFLNGEIRKAIDVLEEGILLEEERKLEENKKQLEKDIENQLKIRLHKAFLLRLDLDFIGARHNYKIATEKYPCFTSFFKFGLFLYTCNEFENAVEIWEKAVGYAIEDVDRVNVLQNLGWSCHKIGKNEEAKGCSLVALEIIEKLDEKLLYENFEETLADLNNNLGLILSCSEGKHEDALVYLQKAYNIYQERSSSDIDNEYKKAIVARTLSNIGYVYSEMWNIPEGINNCIESIKIYSSLSPETVFHFLGNAANTYRHLGNLYKHYNPAYFISPIQFYKELIRLTPHEGDLGSAVFAFRQALRLHQKLLEINPNHHDLVWASKMAEEVAF